MNDPTLDSADLRVGHRLRRRRTGATTTTTSTTRSPTSSARDRDVGYGLMRVSATSSIGVRKHLVQPVSNVRAGRCSSSGASACTASIRRGRSAAKVEPRPAARKWPRLPPARPRVSSSRTTCSFRCWRSWNAPRVFAGNLAANVRPQRLDQRHHLLRPLPEGARVFTRGGDAERVARRLVPPPAAGLGQHRGRLARSTS